MGGRLVIRPNFLVLVDDDLNVQSMSELAEITDFIGAQGAQFANSFVSCPVCGPARATIFRGQYAHNHRVLTNKSFPRFRDMGHEEDCLPVWLHEAGYRTKMVGKYLNAYRDASHVSPGWSEWYAELVPFWDMHVSNNGVEEPITTPITTLAYADVAEEFLRRTAEPFFLYIGPSAPHAPPEVEEKYADEFLQTELPREGNFNAFGTGEVSWLATKPQLNDVQIAELDAEHRERLRSMLTVRDMFSRLIGALRDTGKLENTYVFFTSDHGYHMGDHRLLAQKLTAFEEDIRVPLQVRGPGIPAGQVRAEMVAGHDIAPTIADLAGIEVPAFVDGRSLKPLLFGETPESWRLHIGIEVWSVVRPANPALPDAPDFRGVRSIHPSGVVSKFVQYVNGETELYRLERDPAELKNIPREANPTFFDRLSAKARALSMAAGPDVRRAEDRR
jgi:arylsulfatase A-like enzyme